jgi:hypothetical protein
MTAERISEVFMYLGAIGVVQFAALAFSARQLQGIAVPRLRRRMSSIAVRHASPLTAISLVVLAAGVMLRL